MLKKRLSEPLIHVLVWVVLFALTYRFRLIRFDPFVYGEGSMFLMILGGTVVNVTVFYATAFRFLPSWQQSGLNRRSLFEPIALLVVVIAFKGGLLMLLLQTYHPGKALPSGMTSILPLLHFIQTSLFIVFGITYRLARDRLQYERVRKELEHQKLAAELAFLKIQVNPHFLFNTLNNLFGLATREGAADTAESILKLADMMRYMMQDSGEDRLPLAREIACLRNYVDLQKLRISKNKGVVIDLRVDGPVASESIPPTMLLTLVENAFKHGISFKEPSEIKMTLSVGDRDIRFRVENKVHPKDETLERETGGIGLENLRRRLVLMYPDREPLICRHEDGHYLAELVLPRSTVP